MDNSIDDRTLRMISQLTRCSTEHHSKWASIPGKVAIVISRSSIKNENAMLALAMSVNCLSRMHPIVTHLDLLIPEGDSGAIPAPLFEGNTIKDCLTSFIHKLKPNVHVKIVGSLENDYDALLSLGTTDFNHSFKVSIASDGWISYASPSSLSTDFTSLINPVGSYAAAILGCSEVFKRIFVKKADLIVPQKSDYDFRWRLSYLQNELRFNTFDYSVNDYGSPNPTIPEIVDVEELSVVGIGAGGGACLYTLSSFENLEGVFDLVDPDEIKDSNLNRYIYAIRSDADHKKPKVNSMREIFSLHKSCKVNCNYIPYDTFSKQMNGRMVDLLISTVDTAKTRIDIQWDLPRIILDAAVAGTQFYVNRIDFDKNPCLGCRFWPEDSSYSVESHLSKIIGLPVDVISILRSNNAKFETTHIEKMKPFSEKYNFQLPKDGERFQDWFIFHCGEIKMDGEINLQIPLPFATVMPGILLAGEVIKIKCLGKNDMRTYFSYDVLHFPINALEIIEKRKDCPICSHKSTMDRYKKKYGK